jgi:hypothetical protein
MVQTDFLFKKYAELERENTLLKNDLKSKEE